MYIPCAALGMILALGSTVAPRLAPRSVLVLEQLLLWLQFWEWVCDPSLLLQLNLSMLLLRALVVSNALWWAALRASS